MMQLPPMTLLLGADGWYVAWMAGWLACGTPPSLPLRRAHASVLCKGARMSEPSGGRTPPLPGVLEASGTHIRQHCPI